MSLADALSRILERDVNAVVAPVAIPAVLRDFCADGGTRALADVDSKVSLPCDADAERVLRAARGLFSFLPSAALVEAAASDALGLWQALVAVLHAATGPAPRALNVRVEIVRDVSCPKFHMDNVALRLLRVYHGPGTEFARNEDVDRKALTALVGSLEPPQVANARIVPDASRVQRTPAEHVLLLKGAKMAGYQGAAVHRSPARSDGWDQRFLLKIDTAADDMRLLRVTVAVAALVARQRRKVRHGRA